MAEQGSWARRWIGNALRPGVDVTAPPEMRIDWNVPVVVRDGTILRVNVFRPLGDDPVPAIMSAHLYGKDNIPAKTRSRRGVSFLYRLFPQPEPVRFSTLTSWEAPDPAWWVSHGYAVINADLRGGGTSDGTAAVLSDQEAEDYYDLVEWAGTQPWCTGRVGLDGVSYLAISQYKVAALRPPHLAAICPWEGFSDLYRDFARPGGIREDGFTIVWSAGTRHAARTSDNVRAEFVRRPERDGWYVARTPDLTKIEAPMLECASFSDHSLHSRGSFEAFQRAGSARKWLYTHRDGKWSHYYSRAASEERLRFFDHILKEIDNGWEKRAPARISVHEFGHAPAAIINADEWPPADLTWTRLHLDARTRLLADSPPDRPSTAAFAARRSAVTWTWRMPTDLDVIGPMALEVHVAVEGSDDAHLIAAVRKFRGGREVTFEGSYGFSHDVVSRGWQRAAHRCLDPELSTPLQPVHCHDRVEPIAVGEVMPVHIALLPHATRFRAGDELRLELRGRWLFPRDPLRGQFPAGYQRGPRARCIIHTGPETPSSLLLGVRSVTVP